MTDDARTIFRDEALQRNAQGPDQVVLPKLIQPRTFLCLWLLLGLLAAAAALVITAEVPQYASGTAVVAESNGTVELVLLLPAERHGQLRVGQTVWVRWMAGREPARTRITQIEPQLQSPAEVRERFGLSSETVNRAVAVVTADPQGVVDDTAALPLELHRGSIAAADVEIGTRRAIWLLLDAEK